jgi:predicted DNA-binding transcriptional regulator YafY
LVDSAERLINLALFLAGTRDPVTAAQCRSAGLGYPEGQDALAFDRMFERDKDTLRAAGLPIEVDRRGEVEAYRLDASAYAAPITLSAEEVAALSAVAAAARHDPSFPLAGDLSYALAKLGHAESTDPVAGRLADEAPEQQGETAAELAAAISARKRARFGYTNVAGTGGTREVEPYALFLREGRWYLVGRDIERGELRTYTLARMTDLAVNGEQPKTPDFEREPGFDAASFVLLPFQYGPLRGEVTLRFAPELAWRAERLTAGQGTLKAAEDGSITWRVPVADEQRLLRWIVENGPGILPLDARLRDLLAAGLRRVVTAHGG